MVTEQLIYESKKSKIYFLEESEFDKPVLLKILNYEFPTPKDIEQFYNEFEIIDGLGIKGTRMSLKKLKYSGKHAMYLEWVKGKTVKEAFKGKQKDTLDFLHIAIRMAEAIAELHEQNIIHKDISGNNIIVDIQDRWVKIIDFGLASKLSLKQQHLGNPEHLDGTLEYISPEQTGRMNRVIDYRTDLYSLGVVLYEMLTGATPFVGLDPLGIVHGHIASVPQSAQSKNPLVPKQISDIVDILLSKKSEDRYQSAYGLKHDLELCLKQVLEKKDISEFPLKTQDFSGKFNLPQKLYGRESELEILLGKFEDVAEGGTSLVLVSGYSGTGKSALVHEIHKPITQKSGYFIEGKFDQYQRDVPYFAILQAFEELIEILMGETHSRLKVIRKDILEAVGEEGKVLTDVLPGLELIVGSQPEVPELGGNEAKNRFNYIFKKFANAVSKREYPVVIFIDDLQWADSSSLSLLQSLVSDPENSHMMFIGAYRDNEVNAAHPFTIMVNDLKKAGNDIYDLKIGNLSLEDVTDLIGDALERDVEEVRGLAGLVHNKTQGNAFFLTQFLRSLYEEELLFFNRSGRVWEFDLLQIKEKNITDNVVELMAGKFLKLPPSTQNVLRASACFGNQFDTETLTLIHEGDQEQTMKDLKAALAEGLILPKGENGFKFAHDRIHQAVYSLINDADKDITHVKIGKQLLQNISEEKLHLHLFDIVNQLNRGVKLILEPCERERLCKLNLSAGIKAKESSAYKTAYDYFINGINLLRENYWKDQYELSLQLHALAGETAYLNGDFQKMDVMIRAVLDNAVNLLEKVKSYEIRILAFKAENKLLEAIKTGLEVLEQLGEKFPSKPTMAHVMVALLKSKIQLSGKNNDTLANLPPMEDEIKIAAMRIMAGIASSSYWATPTLFPLIIFRMVSLSLKYGNTQVSSFAFATYGVIMCGVLGAMKSGYQFGKLGLILLEKYKAKEWKTQVYTPIYCLIINWNEHIDKTLKPLQESYHIGMETGAIEFACINTNIYCIHSYLSGKPLERLEVETKAYSQSFLLFNQETNLNYNEVYHQSMLNLMGQSDDPLLLRGTAYDEEKMVVQNEERNDKTGMFFLHFNKLILSYIFGEYESGIKHADESRKLLEAVLAKFEIPNHHFYEALTMLAHYEQAEKKTRKRYKKRILSNVKKLKTWAKDAPENFQHKYDILMAELYRLKGDFEKAALFYDKAIQGASQQNFIHEEGIARELTGRCYMNQHAESLAEFYLKSSYNAYREWGALAKLKEMEIKYSKYVTGIGSGPGLNSITMMATTSVERTTSSKLDLATILKASSSISQEIILSKLLKRLMSTVMENAGADRGLLLLKSNGKLFIEALAENEGKDTQVLQHINYKDSGLLSESIVSYVTQSEKSIVVQDAKNERRFPQCGFLKDSPVLSVLSLPIMHLGKMVGILYLENNKSTAAFSQERVDLLALLSGQIAVSINNAILYENLEQKVAERTVELEEEKRKSDDLLLNILPAEIADELKRTKKTTPQYFEKVTVMFTDFKGFTTSSELMSPEELVNELGACFSQFDSIIEKYGIEKIKTIGDSYMCVGGLPVPNSTHSIDVVNAALEIRDWMDERNEAAKHTGSPFFEIRIGLDTGPVIAGVVGTKKFAYDIWGDTVNTASRMESSGEIGKINISGKTYETIKDAFDCEYRGKIEAKNKGLIDMYFVEPVKEKARIV
ncbi:MAG: GAF domain-containing protein [Mongoliibacter sp.]|uniref:adenylate/guanylate cyclase domain-containing protein n=1 Tax=Mongoliibacter sp. TaxID=2022438 RepID=UPI0012F033DF|nr:adenylate/guanylate cyclase domain-containing protein [Mongoliibacter sp.]TVP48413.1 MAG: GAF domain-containing protein [Mongoliibacter sp.]